MENFNEKRIEEEIGNLPEEQKELIENIFKGVETEDRTLAISLLSDEEAVELNEKLLKKVKKSMLKIKEYHESKGEEFKILENSYHDLRKVTFNIDNVIKLEGYFEIEYHFDETKSLFFKLPSGIEKIIVKNPINDEKETLDLALYNLKQYFKNENVSLKYADGDLLEIEKDILESFISSLEEHFVSIFDENARTSSNHLIITKNSMLVFVHETDIEEKEDIEENLKSEIKLENLEETKFVYDLEEMKRKKILPAIILKEMEKYS